MFSYSGRTVAKGSALLFGSSAVGWFSYSPDPSAAGFRREALFWSRVGPIVLDYYWKAAESSPYVRYQRKYHSDTFDKKQILSQLHQEHAPQVFQVLLDLRGLYIKLGQVLSVTALPIPEDYRVLFRTLQSDVPGFETFDDVVKPTLEREFQRPLQQLFAYLDPNPCGAASIGQAHKARLRSNNEQVIVKVQYPNAVWQIPADIQCVGDFMKLCVWTGVVDEAAAKLSFDEFSRQFLAELDYNQERRNLQQVYQSSLDPTAPYQRRNVVLPLVYEDYCTDRVITMSYLPGPKLEAEARRQLELLGVDTTKGIGNLVRDAARDAVEHPEQEKGELARRVTLREGDTVESTSTTKPNSTATPWKLVASKWIGRWLGVDSILWAVRSIRRTWLWSQALVVASIQGLPSIVVPTSWEIWAETHQTAMAQARQMNLTRVWIDALFDVHGHQIFNLGLFNADPHPGNCILVVQDDDDEEGENNNIPKTSTKLGLIDYGQCKRLTPKEQVLVAQLILRVANEESDLAIATAFRDMGIVTKNDSTEFLAKFGRLMFGPLRPEHMDHSWHQTLHKQDRVLYFPKELSMVYRTSLLLRGLAMSLQLNYSVGEQWKQHAQEAVDRHSDIAKDIVALREKKRAVNEEKVDDELLRTDITNGLSLGGQSLTS